MLCDLPDRKESDMPLNQGDLEQIQRILIEASIAIKQLTNEMDPNCPLCGGTTEVDGQGHLDDCIVKRCVVAAFELQD